VTITVAPIKRDASTVWKVLATVIDRGHAGNVDHNYFRALARMPRSSCSVS